MRYLLVDKITEIRYDSFIKGVKCITLSEEYLEDHFPGRPIFPGALMLESLAQLSGFLLILSARETGRGNIYPVLSKVEKMKFLQVVQPGECVSLHAEVDSLMSSAAYLNVKAYRDEVLCAAGKLMLVFSFEEQDYPAKIKEYIETVSRETTVIE